MANFEGHGNNILNVINDVVRYLSEVDVTDTEAFT